MRETTRQALRQPVFWLVIGIPVSSIAAAGWLIASALASSGSDDAVAERVQRTAQIQQADLGPDARAARDGLSAVLQRVPGGIVVLPVSGRFDRTRGLRVTLQHPARAELDRTLLLQPGAGGWHASAALPDGHDWRVQLMPPDGGWRLCARLPRGQRAVRLAPAL